MGEECSICGLSLNDEFSHTLKCNHKFHYDCLMKYYISNKNYSCTCPYCRQKTDYLPVVDGLKKIYVGIHVKSSDEFENYHINTECNHIITRGKNKGNQCNKKCQLGYKYCKSHNKLSSSS
jgi:hypothetical protein